jgi:hypothetical protein
MIVRMSNIDLIQWYGHHRHNPQQIINGMLKWLIALIILLTFSTQVHVSSGHTATGDPQSGDNDGAYSDTNTNECNDNNVCTMDYRDSISGCRHDTIDCSSLPMRCSSGTVVGDRHRFGRSTPNNAPRDFIIIMDLITLQLYQTLVHFNNTKPLQSHKSDAHHIHDDNDAAGDYPTRRRVGYQICITPFFLCAVPFE